MKATAFEIQCAHCEEGGVTFRADLATLRAVGWQLELDGPDLCPFHAIPVFKDGDL